MSEDPHRENDSRIDLEEFAEMTPEDAIFHAKEFGMEATEESTLEFLRKVGGWVGENYFHEFRHSEGDFWDREDMFSSDPKEFWKEVEGDFRLYLENSDEISYLEESKGVSEDPSRETCPHDGDTYVDDGGWEYCEICDGLIPADE